jgi:hypothetical protein
LVSNALLPANVARLMLFTAVFKQFIGRIEILSTKLAFRVSTKGGIFILIPGSNVLHQFLLREQLMFMRKALFVLQADFTINV